MRKEISFVIFLYRWQFFRHSTLFQNFYLTGIGLDFFVYGILLMIIIKKKAHPKRAGLREAG